MTRASRITLVCFSGLLAGVIVAPLLRHGSVLLVDYGDFPVGPHASLPASVFGFPPGITSRAPIDLAFLSLFRTLPWPPLYLLPFVLLPALVCLGLSRIFPRHTVAIIAATSLYSVNPFIYERMVNGQVYFVLAYALMPLLASLAVRPLPSKMKAAILGGLLLALQAALSSHFLFISGGLLLVVMAAHLANGDLKTVRVPAGIAVVGLVLSLYWLVPAAVAGLGDQARVTTLDLQVFQTLSDPHWGLFVNVAGLYGFWRPGAPVVKQMLGWWPVILLPMVVVAGFGCYRLARRPGGRVLGWSCLIFGVGGLFLAMGAQGPTGGVFLWLFQHWPGFKIMREPQKFLTALVLAYAVGFGAGAAALSKLVPRPRFRALLCAMVLAAPFLYGFTELWGFDGYIQPSTYPTSWSVADQKMAADATALVLPWHAYLAFDWTDWRIVANPMADYFDRPVISGDDIQAGPIYSETTDPRSLFLQFCLSHGASTTEFGRLIAPLGIRYIVLAKTADWRSYSWIRKQKDLREIYDTENIEVYKNTERVLPAYSPHRVITVANWGSVVGLAQEAPLTDYLIRVRHPSPGRIAPPKLGPRPMIASQVRVVSNQPAVVMMELAASSRIVVWTDPWYKGWVLDGRQATSQFGVTDAFFRQGSAGRVAATFSTWTLVSDCDLAGAVLLGVALILLAVPKARWSRGWRRWVTTATP
jgi:hypothetical protein